MKTEPEFLSTDECASPPRIHRHRNIDDQDLGSRADLLSKLIPNGNTSVNLYLLEFKEGIASSQQKLEATMRRVFPKMETREIGHKGGGKFGAEIWTDGRHWFWSGYDKGRKLNWFGRYTPKGKLEISVEINTPYEGRNNRLAGFFASDVTTGAVYLLHSGKIVCGARAVQRIFLASRTELAEVIDSAGKTHSRILVMPIEGDAGMPLLAEFIDSVVDFKALERERSASQSKSVLGRGPVVGGKEVNRKTDSLS